MNIGEVARRAKLETSAIRYYERYGVLPRPARVSGRRDYDASVFDLLALVQFARGAGFTMREVRELFGAGVGGRISARWRKLATSKIDHLDAQVRQLQIAREMLSRIMACRCVEPAQCGRALRKATA
jgi:MerR family redox-sensitive transcriptional activator SoxR